MPIPAFLHFTGPDGPIPAAYRPEWRDSWAAHHPGHEVRYWRDADLLALASAEYPELLPLFADAGTPGVVKGDFGRLMALHQFGGIYADLDAVCLKPLDPILAGRTLVLSEMARGAAPVDEPYWHRHVHNALMAAVPGHPFVRSLLGAGLATWRAGKIKAPEMIAGPEALRRCWRVYDGGDAYISPPDELCPLSWLRGDHRAGWDRKSVDELRAAFPGAYAITFWCHNW